MKAIVRFLHSLTISLLTVTTCMAQSPSWQQLGNDIDGENANDWSGWSICLSKNDSIVAIGTPSHDGNGANSGQVKVYKWTGTSWIQRGASIRGEFAGDQLGNSVSLNANGNIIAIGEPGNDSSGNNAGRVSIFEWNGNNWIQKGRSITGERPGDKSGTSVSLNTAGNTIAIGAPENDRFGSNSGQTRVYQWNGISWIQKGNDIDGQAAGDFAGWAVSLSGDGNIVAFSSPTNSDSLYSAGKVSIYEWTNNGWQQKGTELKGSTAWNQFGWSIDLSTEGNTVAIGVPFYDGPGFYSGETQIYSWQNNSWLLKGSPIEGEAAYDESGRSVSLSTDGNTVAIGAPYNSETGSNSGHARVYQWNGTTWLQKGSDIDAETTGDKAGWNVSLGSGDVIAVSSPYNDDNGFNSGHTRIFYFNSLNHIQETDFPTALSLSPNPTRMKAVLNLGAKYQNVHITIRNIYGQALFTQQESIAQSLTVELENFASGIYFIEVSAEDKYMTTLRIVKK